MKKTKLNILERATKLDDKRLDYIVLCGLFPKETLKGLYGQRGIFLYWNAENLKVSIETVQNGKRKPLLYGGEMMEDEWLEMMEVDAFSPCLESVHTDSTMTYFEWRECFHPVKK